MRHYAGSQCQQMLFSTSSHTLSQRFSLTSLDWQVEIIFWFNADNAYTQIITAHVDVVIVKKLLFLISFFQKAKTDIHIFPASAYMLSLSQPMQWYNIIMHPHMIVKTISKKKNV